MAAALRGMTAALLFTAARPGFMAAVLALMAATPSFKEAGLTQARVGVQFSVALSLYVGGVAVLSRQVPSLFLSSYLTQAHGT
eukprot:2104744-Rhodomonas_salina.1